MGRQPAPSRRRRITLPMPVLYGVGVTVGAGIHVPIGAVPVAVPAAGVLTCLALIAGALL